jgi:hypothetical protein
MKYVMVQCSAVQCYNYLGYMIDSLEILTLYYTIEIRTGLYSV